MFESSDWLWMPNLEERFVVPALMLALVVGVTVTAALWTISLPGEVTPQERRGRSGHDWSSWLSAWAARLLPALVVLGVLLILFPVSPPQTLLLVSRSRPPERTDKEVTTAWENLVREEGVTSDDRYVDVGPLVDFVCAHLIEETGPNFVWRKDDPGTRARLASAVLHGLEAGPQPESTPTPTQVAVGCPPPLPRWVVESIEISIVKAETQRRNAGRIVVLMNDRQTVLSGAWDQAPSWWKRESGRFRQPLVRLGPLPALEKVRLERVLSIDRNDQGDLDVTCLLTVEPGNAGNPWTMQLWLDPAESVEPVKIKMEPGLTRQIRSEKFHFVGVPAQLQPQGVRLKVETRPGVVEAPQTVPVPREVAAVLRHDPHRIVLRVRDKAEATAWQDTANLLFRDVDTPFGFWRARMTKRGFELEKITFVVETDAKAAPAAIVIDDRSCSGSVWVTLAGVKGQRLYDLVIGPTASVQKKPARAATAIGQAPGLFSLDRLPLVPVDTLPQPAVRSERTNVLSHTLDDQLNLGVLRRDRAMPVPLVSRFTERFEIDGRMQRAVITHIALDPKEQGVLLNKDVLLGGGNLESARLLSFWTTILEAIQHSAAETSAVPEETATDHPQPLLTSSDLHRLRTEATAWGLIPLLAVLIFYSFFILRGYAMAPPPQKGDPS